MVKESSVIGHGKWASRSIHATYSLVVSSFISVSIPLINFGPTWVRFHSHGDLVLAMVQSIYGWARRAVEQVSSIFCQEAVDLLCEDGKLQTTPALVSAVVSRSRQSGRTVGSVLVRGSGRRVRLNRSVRCCNYCCSRLIPSSGMRSFLSPISFSFLVLLLG